MNSNIFEATKLGINKLFTTAGTWTVWRTSSGSGSNQPQPNQTTGWSQQRCWDGGGGIGDDHAIQTIPLLAISDIEFTYTINPWYNAGANWVSGCSDCIIWGCVKLTTAKDNATISVYNGTAWVVLATASVSTVSGAITTVHFKGSRNKFWVNIQNTRTVSNTYTNTFEVTSYNLASRSTDVLSMLVQSRAGYNGTDCAVMAKMEWPATINMIIP